MKREIIFKSIRTDWGATKSKWVEGEAVVDGWLISGHADSSDEYWQPEKWVKINPATVCQFTGLTDKNGNKIWEGDEIRVNDKNQYGKVKKLKYIVKFIKGSFMCVLNESEYEKVFPKSMKNQPNMKLTGKNINDK